MVAVVVFGLGVGALLVGALRPRQAAAPSPGVTPPSSATTATAAPPPAGASVPVASPPPAKQDGGGMGAAGAVAAVGGIAGALSGLVADNQDVKANAPAIGAGLGLAAYLANIGGVASMGTVGAVTFIAAPLLVATFAVTVVVDRVLSAIREEQWKQLLRECARMRSVGQYAEAIALWVKASPDIGEISRRPPNADDPEMNRWVPGYRTWVQPWPGYTSQTPPPPATRDEVRAHPETVPPSIATADGKSIPIRGLLDEAYGDVERARKAAVEGSAPGFVVHDGKVVKVATGDRDMRADATYAAHLKTAEEWARALARAVSWIAPDALVRDARSQVEKAVDGVREAAKRSADAAATKAATQSLAAGLAEGVQTGRPVKGASGGTARMTPGQRATAQRKAGEETAAERKNSGSPQPAGKPGKNGTGVE